MSFPCGYERGCEDSIREDGVPPQYIYNIGAPGLVGIKEDAELRVPEAERYFSSTEIGIKVLCIFHPVVREISDITIKCK